MTGKGHKNSFWGTRKVQFLDLVADYVIVFSL